MGGEGVRVDVRLQRGSRAWSLTLVTGARRVGVYGPSGAGKTTLLRVLAGLEPSAEGEVSFDGVVWQGPAGGVPPWARGVGWVPQEATLFPHASVRQNLGWAGASLPDVEAMAAALGLRALLDRRPRHLSGGERQRVAVGRALLARPRLLLLDEPFAALDPDLRAGVADVVGAAMRSGGAGCVLVSHGREELARLCEEVWVARTDGSLRREGEP